MKNNTRLLCLTLSLFISSHSMSAWATTADEIQAKLDLHEMRGEQDQLREKIRTMGIQIQAMEDDASDSLLQDYRAHVSLIHGALGGFSGIAAAVPGFTLLGRSHLMPDIEIRAYLKWFTKTALFSAVNIGIAAYNYKDTDVYQKTISSMEGLSTEQQLWNYKKLRTESLLAVKRLKELELQNGVQK